MSKPNSLMTQHQLIDSLTSHISLYHSLSTLASPNPNPNPNPRSSIIKWFSSLTVHQRQAHITTVDPKFTNIVLQMLAKIRTQGQGSFIILPDIPSRGLPSLCFKKSRGLLSRFAESNETERRIFESMLLFSSNEGESFENVKNCACSISNCLDSVTVREEFVENVDKFIETMDRVSNNEFLRGEESQLGSDWVELEWLKAKGYYSIEAFVANRLDVALRLAWLNCNNGKKRGVKLKEKIAMAGIAANVYWRKRGCVDWWGNLDAGTRRKVVTAVLGKGAKSLIHEILKGASSAWEDEMGLCTARVEQPLRYSYCLSSQRTIPTLVADAEFGSTINSTSRSGNDTSLSNLFNGLSVLQDISTMIFSCSHGEFDNSKLLFSTLGTVSTIHDSMLRKLRGIIMVISLDCTKFELLGQENDKSSLKKSKEKLGGCSRRKKGRNREGKRLNPVTRSCVDDSSCQKPLKDCGALAYTEKADLMASNKMPGIPQGMETHGEPSLSMEHAKDLVVGKVQTAAGKSRKGKTKNKSSSIDKPTEVRNFETSVTEVSSSSLISQDEAAKFDRASDNLNIQDVCNYNSAGNDILVSNSTPCSSESEPTREDIASQSIEGNFVVGSTEGCHHMGPKHHQFSNSMIENINICSRVETSNHKVDCSGIRPAVPALKFDCVSSGEDINIQNSVKKSETDAKSTFLDKPIGDFDLQEESVLIQEQKSGNFCGYGRTSASGCTSYEWPSASSLYFPSIDSHLPAATDRLHLDVGRNWQNHFHQSFLSTMHQARSSSTKGGCNRIMSQPLPMSLDWPPMVRSARGLLPAVTYNYNSGFISSRHSTFQQGFTTHSVQLNATTDDERKYSRDLMDLPDITNGQELTDECDNHWISEEEFEVHAVSGIDYNQYFGGGVMYWNPSDHPGTGFSRPPSLSSDDSSWAWHEADMKRAVDDMVAFSSSYSTNGLTSPTAASYCSPFDPLGPGHQALGYVVPGNEVPAKVLHSSSIMADGPAEEEVPGSLANLPGDVEGKTSDTLPYPVLRPIIIPMSRERSRSDFKRSHDHKSPCVPPTRREQPRIKRPPSPVVLCVPRAPCPPPPSPVSDSRKHRGLSTVRSGSSSPRHWGMRGWYHDGTNLEEACVRIEGSEVVWPSWRNKNLPARPMIQPLPGALLQDRLIAMSQLARDQEHPDVAFPLQPPELPNSPPRKASLSLIHRLLHDEIDSFCKQVAAHNVARKPYINWAVKRVTRSLQVLWPRSRTNIFGSNATGLSLPTSDVDLVVCLPPVRNLEPIKEAGILEGRNGIKETCLQHAARYLANQEWVKNDSLKTVENTAIPIIMLVVEVPHDLISSASSNVQSPKEEPSRLTGEDCNHVHSEMVGLEDCASPKFSQINSDNTKDSKSVRVDISFRSASHTGLQTTELVKELTDQFPAATPLALVLKQFLADRSLDHSYSGGLSSYCLVLLITRFLQHEHHLGRPINQNFGSLLMDFLYFFGNVFDPRLMRISVQGSGVYINRERGYSIDPIHIDDPLFPTNNVGRNCFRIHQCIKAFSEAYSLLQNELTCLPSDGDTGSRMEVLAGKSDFQLSAVFLKLSLVFVICRKFKDDYGIKGQIEYEA